MRLIVAVGGLDVDMLLTVTTGLRRPIETIEYRRVARSLKFLRLIRADAGQSSTRQSGCAIDFSSVR